MYLFGHLGFGSLVVQPWWRRVPARALWLGCMLPDLIDKPIYYLLCWWTGRRGGDLGMFGGTRSIGHTAIFMVMLFGVARVRHSQVWLALALGVLTHLFFDNLLEIVIHPSSWELSSLLWPLYGWNFPVSPYPDLMTQLGHVLDSLQFRLEVAGLIIFVLLLYFRRWEKTQ